MDEYGRRVADLNRAMANMSVEKCEKMVMWVDDMNQGLKNRLDARVGALGRLEAEIRTCRNHILELEQRGEPKSSGLVSMCAELSSRRRVLQKEIDDLNKTLNPC